MKVVVLAPRGLPLGFLGCYGNGWIATPAGDRLAAEGVVFDQHYADRPDAAGARRAWRTGRYRLPLPEGDGPPPADQPDLLALLRTAGVATLLVSDASRPAPAEFAAGWEQVAETVALDRLAGRERGLLWLDLATPLPPWDVPEPFRASYFRPTERDEEDAGEETEEPLAPLTDPAIGPLDPDDDATLLRVQNSCAAAVSCLDAELGRLLDRLRERGLLDKGMLLLTADHGQALGEHGFVGPHRPWLHDELTHLPLVLRLPGGARAGRRVGALTQAVDLAPTLLDAFGLAVPPEVHGVSLLPLARGEVDRVRAYACSGLAQGDAAEWALRTPGWGFLLPLRVPDGDPPRPPQLYVKPDDRWEVNDVRQHHLELAEHLEQVLRDFAEAARQPGPLRPPMLRDVEAELAETAPEGGEP